MDGVVIVAGARKAGTSWLYEAAAADSRIAVPTIRKELGFFDDHFHRGADWYARQFDAASSLRLDCSPAYFAKPDVPARIASTLKPVRVAFVLRAPVDRLVSDFHHARRRGDIPPGMTIEEAVTRMPSLREESRYGHQLERWLAEDALGEFAVLFHDDLVRDPQAFYDAFCASIGLDAMPLPAERLEPVFERSAARSAGMMRMVMAGTRFLHRRNLSWIVRPFSRSRRVRGVFERPPDTDDSTLLANLNSVAEDLASDTEALCTLLRTHPRVRCFGAVPPWAQSA